MAGSRKSADPLRARVQARTLALTSEALTLVETSPTPWSPQDVHRLRVVGKTLRATWQLLVPALGRAAVRPMEQAVRDAARRLSGPREAHVLRRTIGRLVRRHGAAVDALDGALPATQAMAVLLELVAERWPQTQAPPALAEPMAAMLRAQFDAVARLPEDLPGLVLVEGVVRSYRHARRAGRRAIAEGDDEAWHRCRRWVKYELYQLRLLDGRRRPGRRSRRLERFGDRLGDFHDLCDLRALVADAEARLRLQDALAPIEAMLALELKPLRARLQRDHRRLYARPPRRRRERLARRLLRGRRRRA